MGLPSESSDIKKELTEPTLVCQVAYKFSEDTPFVNDAEIKDQGRDHATTAIVAALWS